MPQTSFYSPCELKELGLKAFGENVLISRKASIYGPGAIVVGNHVRIDDFCLLSGEITLGSYIHISAYSALYGRFGIEMHDFSGLSPRTTVFSASDDFSGEYMVGPMLPAELTRVSGGKVTIGRYVQVGAGSVILPSLTLDTGCAVGSMSLVNKSLEPWTIYAGVPARAIKARLQGAANLSLRLPGNA